MRIFRSPFGLMLQAIKSNQNRLSYTGFNTRPYTLTAFVISGMYAGLAGGLLACTDPLAGRRAHAVDRLGRGGADDHPRRRRHAARPGDRRRRSSSTSRTSSRPSTTAQLHGLLRLPARRAAGIRRGSIAAAFVGDGWQLTLGVIFMLVVIFLPGGLMEGVRRIGGLVRRGRRRPGAAKPSPRRRNRSGTMGILDGPSTSTSASAACRRSPTSTSTVEEGTVHAIIGPNGAGKSTLLNCFVGQLVPDTGTVIFDGTLAARPQAARDQPDRRQPRVPDAGDLRRSDACWRT